MPENNHAQDEDIEQKYLPAARAQEADTLVATAKQYPRSITEFKKRIETLALLDEETAASCFYVLPRDKKNIEGPSARFAEIVAYGYKNLRAEARPVEEDEKFVTSRGTAWDVENNVLVAFEVKRRITDRYGRRYGDDMIMVTQNAASSIAFRNAVLRVVPKSFWNPIYEKCRQMVKGDIKTLADRRAASLAAFQKLGVSADRIFTALDVKGEDDITPDHLLVLRGYYTAIKDEGHSIDEIFPEQKKEVPSVRKSEAKAETAEGEKEVAATQEKPKKKTKAEIKADEESQRLEELRQYIEETTDQEFLALPLERLQGMTKGLPVADISELLLKYNKRKSALAKPNAQP